MSNATLREALELIQWSNDSAWQAQCARAALAADDAARGTMPDTDMIAALRHGQQADVDGVMLLVSRQACEEAASALEWLREEFGRECRDADNLLFKLGLSPENYRTDGGSLRVAKVVADLQASRAAAPRPTMRPDELADRIERGEKWMLADQAAAPQTGHDHAAGWRVQDCRACDAAPQRANPEASADRHTLLGALMNNEPLNVNQRSALYELLASAAPQSVEPVALDSIEQYRMQMAGISTAAIGYWKEGDAIHPDYDTSVLRDVAKLYAKYDALYKAATPTAPTDAEWQEEAMRLHRDAMTHYHSAITASDATLMNARMPAVEERVRRLRAHIATRPAQGDALDAARYRWLRDNPWQCDLMQIIQFQQNARWDAAIDVAMSAPPTKKEAGA